MGTLFRSESIANIVTFFVARGIARVPVAELERELERQAKQSRGAVENALQFLVKADLVGISLSGRNRICEVRRPKVWAKLGELFDLERERSEVDETGMPWLAELVAGKPRRSGFKPRLAEPEPQLALENTEAMLAKLPELEPSKPGRRSPAPGRRR